MVFFLENIFVFIVYMNIMIMTTQKMKKHKYIYTSTYWNNILKVAVDILNKQSYKMTIAKT